MIQVIAKAVKGHALAKQLKGREAKVKRALDRTMGDLRRSAPGKVADAVRAVYNLKKGDLMPGSNAATVTMAGSGPDKFNMRYRGRVLTPTHFGMAPKAKPAGRRKYTPALQIKKNRKVKLTPIVAPGRAGGAFARPAASPYFLGSHNGSPGLLMQRHGNNVDKVFRTLSVPQMVGSKQVASAAQKALAELSESRLEHNLKRALS